MKIPVLIEHLWPETVLLFLAVWILVVGAFQQSRTWWTVFALIGYALVALTIWRQDAGSSGSLNLGPIVVDELGYVLRLLAVLVGALFTLISARIVREQLASEFLGILMLLIAGVMLATRANDLVLMFVALELISVPTYVLLYLGRRDRATSEATAKYFFLSIMSSAVLLYGMSFLYGLAGTTILTAEPGSPSIASALSFTAQPQAPALSAPASLALAPLALVLIVAGLGFKIAAVPFHFYAPDVYQGATNGNAGLLAIAPKIGGLAAMIRILVVAMPNTGDLAWQLLLVVSIASMTLGNVCALWQNNVRRLMAFSSIAHAGYMLIGVVVALGTGTGTGGAGVGAAVLYVVVYSLATAGTFAALAYLGGIKNEVNDVQDLSGLGKTNGIAAGAIAVCMVSLAGIPPLAGFWGKFTLFSGAIQVVSLRDSGAWFVVLAIAGGLNAAIAAAYYLRIIAVMYFGAPTRQHDREGGWGALTATIAAAILVIAVGILPGDVIESTRRAENSLQRLTTTRQPSNIASNVKSDIRRN